MDDLRWGDNVVWQVEQIDDYRNMVNPFVAQCLADHRRVVYMRFGQHPPILQTHPRIMEYQLDANLGFEAFSSRVHSIASSEGEGVCYVFDSLSDLLSAWVTDLMIGNFFRITCPYLFKLDTIAYFALLKNRNSYATIARIRETTQLLLDLYRFEDRTYVHPLKVWNRYSPTMYLPHVSVGEDFVPITSSRETALFFSRFQSPGPGNIERKLDHWDNIFLNAQEILENSRKGYPPDEIEEAAMIDQLTKMMVGRDEKVLDLARRYFRLEDLWEMHNRLVGSGFIGGKAVGMLLARKILQTDSAEWSAYLEPHDSFYVGSDVYFTYLVENDCWNLRQKQKQPQHYFSSAEILREKILNGFLPAAITDQLRQMLDYFGQSPVIVRSSSLLEDGFGNAFAGKYESVFCVNQGNPQDRYQNFENAVKAIYASTMNEDALSYRLQRGMAESDEQMALLVQRVSGSHRSPYFFPDLAGVAMSHNPYVWREDLNAGAGMVRLVLGLGTRAVDRVDDDYPRIIALDKPSLRPDSDREDIRRFSQRRVDVLNTGHNKLETVDLAQIAQHRSGMPWWKQVAQLDHETMQRLRQIGREDQEVWILTFEEFLGGSFPKLMGRILKTLEQAYAYSVDTEFALNFGDDGSLQINLLQCRPLQTYLDTAVNAASLSCDQDDMLFSTCGNSMGGNIQHKLERVIYVQPAAYTALPLNDQYQIARLVGRLNRLSKERSDCHLMLIGPGRWGSSTPSLGVPVSFAEICNASVLVEVASSAEGYMPELSFGTHFFQDLVETRIFYTALFPSQPGVVFNHQLLDNAPNCFSALMPEYARWESVIRVIEPAQLSKELWIEADMQTQQTICFLRGSDVLGD
ncbi:MAG: PEP/pyruvate-binding domain-containing protein [Firmicutes bacterium]|nr:PEP/pyruvate-binding domain-containing protein [Bacillota bacterium]